MSDNNTKQNGVESSARLTGSVSCNTCGNLKDGDCSGWDKVSDDDFDNGLIGCSQHSPNERREPCQQKGIAMTEQTNVKKTEGQASAPRTGSIFCIDCLKELGQDDQRIIITKNVDSLEDDLAGPFCEECYDFITTHAGE